MEYRLKPTPCMPALQPSECAVWLLCIGQKNLLERTDTQWLQVCVQHLEHGAGFWLIRLVTEDIGKRV